jgi:hypothetical protein
MLPAACLLPFVTSFRRKAKAVPSSDLSKGVFKLRFKHIWHKAYNYRNG